LGTLGRQGARRSQVNLTYIDGHKSAATVKSLSEPLSGSFGPRIISLSGVESEGARNGQIDACAGLDDGTRIPDHSHQVGYDSRVHDVHVPTGFGCLPAPVLITQVSISSVLVAKAK
jgi:hypothetical protein